MNEKAVHPQNSWWQWSLRGLLLLTLLVVVGLACSGAQAVEQAAAAQRLADLHCDVTYEPIVEGLPWPKFEEESLSFHFFHRPIKVADRGVADNEAVFAEVKALPSVKTFAIVYYAPLCGLSYTTGLSLCEEHLPGIEVVFEQGTLEQRSDFNANNPLMVAWRRKFGEAASQDP